jgi:signal transduction histidine kinase
MNLREIRKKRPRSLYVYLSISFLVILIVDLFSTALYFGYIRNNFIDVEKVEKIIINPENVDEISSEIKNAMIYGLTVGLALIIVVASHIIRPIRRLTEATKKVASGDFNVNVEIKRNDEIGDLTYNFNKMVQEINSIEYLRKDFISNVSHELKTPLASIKGFTKLLADDNLSKEERKEYIDIILEEITRLSNISNNMMKLSKFENQEIVTNKKEYRLDEQLRKAVIMLDEKINEKNINVTLKSKPTTITEDPDIVMEIWLNILGNAIKYTKTNGKIDISLIPEEQFIKVAIKDNGIGIAKEKQNRIFEKFYQADKSHSQEGSGLGLAIVKRIVDLIDGKIEFKSEENKGTTFSVYIKNKKY